MRKLSGPRKSRPGPTSPSSTGTCPSSIPAPGGQPSPSCSGAWAMCSLPGRTRPTWPWRSWAPAPSRWWCPPSASWRSRRWPWWRGWPGAGAPWRWPGRTWPTSTRPRLNASSPATTTGPPSPNMWLPRSSEPSPRCTGSPLRRSSEAGKRPTGSTSPTARSLTKSWPKAGEAPMFPARPRLFPGFGLSLGVTTLYLSLVVLLPLAALILRAAGLGWQEVARQVSDPRVLASLKLSFGASLAAAGLNGVFGLLLAWCLARYPFPGRRLVDAAVDLPFALPTAVSGIALTAVYAPTGWVGRFLDGLGLRVAFTPLGVVLALVFVG